VSFYQDEVLERAGGSASAQYTSYYDTEIFQSTSNLKLQAMMPFRLHAPRNVLILALCLINSLQLFSAVYAWETVEEAGMSVSSYLHRCTIRQSWSRHTWHWQRWSIISISTERRVKHLLPFISRDKFWDISHMLYSVPRAPACLGFAKFDRYHGLHFS
jgi:hypothetical protein